MADILKLPLNSIPYQNVNDITLDNISDALFDGYIDEFGNTNKRPGLLEFANLENSSAIDGLFSWEAKKLIIVVSDGNIFTIDASGNVNDITGDQLEVSTRCSFAENGNFVVIANGGQMVYTDGVSNTIAITSPNAPTQVTHVAFLDYYLLANEKGDDIIRFADFENVAPTTWLFADFFQAESLPDGILAMLVSNGIIYLFGENSIEFWVNNGVNPFARQSTQRERGLMSPYSVVLVNDSFYFFDSRRRLTLMNGFNARIVNTSFDKTIQQFEKVDDALADYCTVIGKNWVVFNFPDAGRTLVYDLNGPATQYWAEWSAWFKPDAIRKRFFANNFIYAKFINKHLIGSYQTGKVLELSETAYDDDGTEIHFLKRTGHIDYEAPYNLKISYEIIVRMLSGIGLQQDSNAKATARIRWRDNGDTSWSNYVDIDLSNTGNTQFLKNITQNGSYYTRQYEIVFTDNSSFVMGKSYERVDINEF